MSQQPAEAASWRIRGTVFNPEENDNERVALPVPMVLGVVFIDPEVERLGNALGSLPRRAGSTSAVGMASCVGPALANLVKTFMLTCCFPVMALLLCLLCSEVVCILAGVSLFLVLVAMEMRCLHLVSLPFVQEFGSWPVNNLLPAQANIFGVFFFKSVVCTALEVSSKVTYCNFIAELLLHEFNHHHFNTGPHWFLALAGLFNFLTLHAHFASTAMMYVPVPSQWREGGHHPDYCDGHRNPLEVGVTEWVKAGRTNLLGQEKAKGVRFTFTPLWSADGQQVTSRQMFFALGECIGLTSLKQMRTRYALSVVSHTRCVTQKILQMASQHNLPSAASTPLLTSATLRANVALVDVGDANLSARQIDAIINSMRSAVQTYTELKGMFTHNIFVLGLLHKGLSLQLQTISLSLSSSWTSQLTSRMIAILLAAYNCYDVAMKAKQIDMYAGELLVLYRWFGDNRAAFQRCIDNLDDAEEKQKLHDNLQSFQHLGERVITKNHRVWLRCVATLFCVNCAIAGMTVIRFAMSHPKSMQPILWLLSFILGVFAF